MEQGADSLNVKLKQVLQQMKSEKLAAQELARSVSGGSNSNSSSSDDNLKKNDSKGN